jgi:hypothetical protein
MFWSWLSVVGVWGSISSGVAGARGFVVIVVVVWIR